MGSHFALLFAVLLFYNLISTWNVNIVLFEFEWQITICIWSFLFVFTGIDEEGIFRVPGNAKVVEKLKESFEKTGDANLDAIDDVYAVAGLLKLFLRELPESVIPAEMNADFIDCHESKSTQPVKSDSLIVFCIYQLIQFFLSNSKTRSAQSFSLGNFICIWDLYW